MAFTYDPTTDAGKVRLLATDTVDAYAIFTDAEIDTFLDLEDGVVKRAGALALETIASSTALIDKKAKTGDITTDGPAVAKALMDRAAQLRASVDTEVAFDWAEMALSTTNAADILYNSALRADL